MNSSNNNKNPYFLPIGNSGMMKQWIVDNVDIPAIKHCHVAGVSMNPGTAVYAAADGKIYPYQITEDDLYIGILESPAYVGKAATVQYAGYLKLEGTGWQPGLAYFATNGGTVVANAGGRQVAVGTGTDAIVVLSGAAGGGAVEDNLGVYFVDKRYEDAGAATITGWYPADITSTNASYNSQLSKAKRGSVRDPWPDPWSARNQALKDIADGLITQATIIVLSGEWTLGFSDYTKNGSSDGTNPNNGTVPDIGFSASQSGANYTNNRSSLVKNGLNFFFHPGTKITKINSEAFSTLMFIFEGRATNTKTEYNASMQGHLDYVKAYSSYFDVMVNIPNGSLSLEYNSHISLKGFSFSFYIYPFRDFNLNIKEVKSLAGGGEFLWFYDDNRYAFPNNHQPVDGGISQGNVHIGNFVSLPADDKELTEYTTLFYFFSGAFYQRWSGQYLLNLKADNVYIEGAVAERFRNLTHIDGVLPFNSQFNVHIGNASIKAVEEIWYDYSPNTAETSVFTIQGSCYKSEININCDNLATEYPIFRTFRMNTQDSTGAYADTDLFKANIRINNCIKTSNTYLSTNQISTNWLAQMYDNGNQVDTTPSSSQLRVSGNYISDKGLIQFKGGATDSYNICFSGVYKNTDTNYTSFSMDTDKTDFLSIIDATLVGSAVGLYCISPGFTYGLKTYNILIKNVMATRPVSPTRVNQVGETITVNSSLNTFLT